MDYNKKYQKYKYKYLQSKHHQKGGNVSTYEDTIAKIDNILIDEMHKLKSISMDDLCGLHLRVYERNGKDIKNICFIPPKTHKFISDLGDYNFHIYAEEKLPDIYTTPMKDVLIDFKTKENEIKLCFADNYAKGQYKYIQINLPIKFVDFIHKIFDHFDEVGLVGYPDNGGIDCITYDPKLDIYKIGTWS